MASKYSRLSLLGLATTLVAGSVVAVGARPAAAASASVATSISASPATAASGTTITATVGYRCSSLTTNCAGASLVVSLPAPLNTPGNFALSPHVLTNPTWDGTARTLTYTFVNPLPAGSTGQLQFTTSFPQGTTINNRAVNAVSTMSATGATNATASVTLTATAGQAWKATPSQSATQAQLGTNFVYKVQGCPNPTPSTGGLNLASSQLKLTLPAGATFVSATNSGTFSAGVVTWNFATATAYNACTTQPSVTVVYPAATFANNQIVTVTANGSGTVLIVGGGTAPVTFTPNSITTTLLTTIVVTPPTNSPAATTTKAFCCGSLYPNMTAQWTVTVKNTGNVTNTAVSVTDVLPDGTRIPSAGRIPVGNTAGYHVNIYYSTAKAPRTTPVWTLLAGGPYLGTDPGTSVTTAPTLAAGLYITALRYDVVEAVASGKQLQWRIDTLYTGVTDAGATIAAATVVKNCATQTYTYSTTNYSVQGCAQTTTVNAFTKIDTTKSPSSYPTVQVGATTTFTLTVKNNDYSWYDVNNPVVADVVPKQAGPGNGTWAASYSVTGLGGTTFTAASDFTTVNMPDGRTILRWQFHGALTRSSVITITVTEMAKQAPAYTGYVDYLWAFGTATTAPLCSGSKLTDTENVLGGGVAGKGCQTSSGFYVAPVAGLGSLMEVKGQLDSAWSHYPTLGQTNAGGHSDYRITITNSGTVDMTSIKVMDLLPTVGDTAVTDPSLARGSQWAANLTGAVSAPAGVTVQYSTSPNPCRAAYGVTTGCDAAATWSASLPADVTTVHSIQLDFGTTVLSAGQSMTFSWPMQSPVFTLAGLQAWNSFAYLATRNDTGVALLPAEPMKTGINNNAPSQNTIGGRVWMEKNLPNGIQDAGENGFNGMHLMLVNATTGVTIDDRISANGGLYAFTGIPDGSYYLEADWWTFPTNTIPTLRARGADRTKDSDFSQTYPYRSDTFSVSNNGTAVRDLGIENCAADGTCF